jgi:hypothetical protein
LGGRPKAQEMVTDPSVILASGQAKNLHAVGMKVTPIGSNQVSYLVRRLKRDAANPAAPNHAQAKDALAKLQAGTIVSARAAGIAAGIVRVPTPLDLLRRRPLRRSARATNLLNDNRNVRS